MSVIAISGVPSSVNNTNVGSLLLKHLKLSVKGDFELMNLWTNKRDKTAYLRLSEKLDPQEVVENINSKKRGSIYAYIPSDVPDFPLRGPTKSMPMSTNMISSVHLTLEEMQNKFAGLYDLSASTAHKLLNDIARVLFKRFNKIVMECMGTDNTLKLTKMYRKRYPHFGDFQLILSTLYSIQNAEGKPRVSIQESDLTSYSVQSYVIDNIPSDKVQSAYTKYLDKITHTITDHIKNLDMTPRNTSPEEIARIKIREQLQSLLPYIPVCIQHATFHSGSKGQTEYLKPQQPNCYSVYMYGEPALPSQMSVELNAFLKQHKVTSTKRSDRMHNKIYLEVPQEQYLTLLDADGTHVGGCKLIIRPSNLPLYKLPLTITRDMIKQLTGNM